MDFVRRLLDTLASDTRYTFRTLRKNPGFALTAIVTLALGIGANTAVFTLVRAVLLRPLNYPEPERLVQIGRGTQMQFEQIRSEARSYTAIGEYLMQTQDVALAEGAAPEVLKEARVSGNFLNVLGVQPLLGRGFTDQEDTPAGPPVVIISAELWQRRFGGDPSIVGRAIDLAGTPTTVVGVMPQDFRFPFEAVSVWVPQPAKDVTQFSPLLVVFGRLRPDVTLAQASAETAVIYHAYMTAHPEALDKLKPVAPLKDELVANIRSMLWLLFGAVSFVLLIACANVAGLLLARAVSRAREFTVRAALGAPRRRLVAQLLTESTVMSLMAGALGLLLALWMLGGIGALAELDLPRLTEVHLDYTVLAFAFATSIVTGMLFGLLPSLAASRPDLAGALKSRGESLAGAHVGGFQMRSALVAGQVALSIVLLTGTALLIESLGRLARVDPGFDPSHLLTMRIALSPTRYAGVQPVATFYEELLRRVESLPGVRAAAVSLTIPMTGYPMTPSQPAAAPLRKLNERPLGMIQFITPDYFRTMRIPLRRGREFTDHDRAGETPAVILNEAMARLLWPEYPNFDPIGQQILIGVSPNPVQIVGIVADMRQSLEGEFTAAMYRSAFQAVSPSFMFTVRTEGDPLRMAEPIRREVLAIDPAQPISDVKTMDEVTESSEGQRRIVLLLLGVFAGAATLLTMIGIYGAISYWVVQRTRELGIRRALGAPAGNILWLVMGRGLGLAAAGVAIGVAGAASLTRLLRAMLFHVSPTDPATLAVVALITAAMSAVASYLPARRAIRVDPMDALRTE